MPETRAAEIPTTITVTEGKHLRVKLGVGYGTEEHARGTIEWRHVNFLGGARMAGIDAKWSSLDRGAKVTFTAPHFLRSGTTLNVSGTNWWTNEPTYTSQRYGGRVTLTSLIRGGSQSGRSEAAGDATRCGLVSARVRVDTRSPPERAGGPLAPRRSHRSRPGS